MNYKTLLLISMTLISTSLLPKPPTKQHQYTHEEIANEVELWVQRYFAPKLYADLTYTEDLFMRIKQHLIAFHYIQHMPHKELKKIVKVKIIAVQQKKHHTEKWIAKHKKHIKETVQDYLKEHPYAHQQKIFEYLNTCTNKTCLQLQHTLRQPDMLPALIRQSVKEIITTAQK